MLQTILVAISLLTVYVSYVTTDIHVNYELAFPAFRLCILHQNDIHGHFGQVNPSGNPCTAKEFKQDKCYGSFARAVSYVKHSYDYFDNVLNVYAGDFYQGTMLYSLFKSDYVVDMVKWMKYDAIVPGDTEFVDGLKGLLPLIRKSSGFLCTNIKFNIPGNATLENELKTLCPEYTILNFTSEENILHSSKAHRVGVVGYTTPKTTNILHVEHVEFEDEVVALTRAANYLYQERGVKIIVAVGHSGYDRDLEIAHKVPHLDVIIGGHSHTLNWPNIFNPFEAGMPPHEHDTVSTKGAYPTVVTKTNGRTVLVANMFKHGKYMGELVLNFNGDGEVIRYWGMPFLLTKSMEEDVDTQKEYDGYTAMLEVESQNVVGTSLVDLIGMRKVCCNRECSLGNTFTDAVIWMLQQDIKSEQLKTVLALVNSGSIKQTVVAGKLTLHQLMEAMPYQNTIDVLTITGAILLKALEHGVARVNENHGSFIQMSGVRIIYNMSMPVGSRIYSVLVACADCQVTKYQPVLKSQVYRVAVTNYMSMGGDGYHMLHKQRLAVTKRHELDLDILVKYINKTSPLYSRRDGRIQYIYAQAKHISSGGDDGRQPLSLRSLSLLMLGLPLFWQSL